MSNDLALPVTNAITVEDFGIFEGVAWFRTTVPGLDFDAYKALPSVVKYDGATYIKMSFNTDNSKVSYKQSDKVAFA